MLRKLDLLKNELQKMYGVELLEYHNKNLLSGDNKTRCEDRQNDLIASMNLIDSIEKDFLKSLAPSEEN